jgi:hypothetical protein
MKRVILALMLSIGVTITFAQQSDTKKEVEEKKGKLLESLNLDSLNLNIQRPEAQIQEQVKVEAEDYPGLNVTIESPAESLGAYKPYTRQELRAYSDLITDYTLSYRDASGTARPHRPGKLFQVGVPD